MEMKRQDHSWSVYMSSCCARSINRVPEPVVSEAGVSPPALVLLSLECTHLAVVTSVAEIRVDRALVPVGVCSTVCKLSYTLW
jgi:hypothetical protein